MTIFDENPFTVIGVVLGVIIGFILPSGLDLVPSLLDYSNISSDPVGTIQHIFLNLPIIIFVDLISGLVFGAVGFVIDSINK